jgi:hypothetical protein
MYLITLNNIWTKTRKHGQSIPLMGGPCPYFVEQCQHEKAVDGSEAAIVNDEEWNEK